MEKKSLWSISNRRIKKLGRFNLVKDAIVLPNTESFSYSFLDIHPSVCILPVTREQKVVCLRQYRHPLNQYAWELPAGRIDDVNEDPLDVAKRELKEETGFHSGQWVSLGAFYPSPGSTNEKTYLFLATGLVSGEQDLESTEEIETFLLNWHELEALIRDDSFRHGAGLAAVLRYRLDLNPLRPNHRV